MTAVIRSDDPRLIYHGRISHIRPWVPVLAWCGTEVLFRIRVLDPSHPVVLRFRFGPGMTTGVVQEIGQNWFDVRAGESLLATFNVPQGTTYVKQTKLPVQDGNAAGIQVTLFKRSEARAGTTALLGIELSNAELIAPPPEPRLHIAFYGDSVTVGACDEDGAEDQWEDRSTHDYYYSYAAIVTRALGAAGTTIAVSGMGVVTGWVPFTAEQVRDRTAPDPAAPLCPPDEPEPDIVVIALGENDDSVTRANGRLFPTGFSKAYVRYVRGLRARSPHSLFVCLLGGMPGGSCGPELIGAWSEAVRILADRDPHLRFLHVEQYSETHPRIPAQYALATDLLAFLREDCGLDAAAPTE